jgi:hypothetical protein
MNGKPTPVHSSRDIREVEPHPDWLKVVRTQVESLKFGTVQITVHDSRVVQIERVEKTRLDRLQQGS